LRGILDGDNMVDEDFDGIRREKQCDDEVSGRGNGDVDKKKIREL